MESFVEPEVRRRRLVKRLLAHNARRKTVCYLAGLTRDQVAALRERWGVPTEVGRRGPSPTSFKFFFRSPRTSAEASVLGIFCHTMGVTRMQRRTAHHRGVRPLELGESLCDVLEAYRACFPSSQIELEQLLLLSVGLREGDRVSLERCGQCRGTLMVDRLAARGQICAHCQRITTTKCAAEQAALITADGEPADPRQSRLFP